MPAQAAQATTEQCQPANNRDNIGRFARGHLINVKSPIYTQPVHKIRAAMEAYLAECKESECSPTIPGLAATLGFTSRQAFWNFLNKTKAIDDMDSKRRNAILDTVNLARLHIEAVRVQRLVDGKGSTAGAIFDLKNNHNYIDKVEQVQDTHIIVTWEQPALDVQAEESQGNRSLIEG